VTAPITVTVGAGGPITVTVGAGSPPTVTAIVGGPAGPPGPPGPPGGAGGSGSTTDAGQLTSGTLTPARIADGSLPFAKMTGVLADAQIPAGIARDTEVTAAVAALVNTWGLDLIATADPLMAVSSSTTGLVNRIVFQRIFGSGPITKVGIGVTVTGGNVVVSLYRSNGAGRNAVPGTLVASTGIVATPAVGYAEVSLGGTFTVQPGDWFAFGCDSGSAAFRSITGNLIDGGNFAGRAMYGNPGFPPPDSPTGLTTGLSRGPLVIGVP
jgi:hypothetical protein